NSPSMLDQQRTVRHIKAMASGSAVRADKPFQEVQAPVRDTVAIDMEGAAFGLVMSRHPQTRWLIVKGVCDYADQTKNDAYHDYPAYASASYALRFIQAYVTEERLPRYDGPSSRTGPSRSGSAGLTLRSTFPGELSSITNRITWSPDGTMLACS